MADVVVETLILADLPQYTNRTGVVWTDKDIGYLFFSGSAGASLLYRKTTDGGATWSSAISLGATFLVHLDIWFDRWTPGDAGTKIHIWWLENTTDDLHYRSLDTSDDSLGTSRIIHLGTTFGEGTRDKKMVSGTKAVGGNLYVQFWGDQNGERGFYRSEDSGANWFGRTDGADGDEVDEVICLPNADSSDDQDICIVYWDRSTNALSIKKYDDSLNTWSTTGIAAGIQDSTVLLQMSAMVRHSDGFIIGTIWSKVDDVTADLLIFEISLAIPAIGFQTNVVTNSDDCVCCSILINQNNNDLYVAYLGNEDGSQEYQATLTAFYKKSTDGGVTWGSQTAYQEGVADDMRYISAGCSTPGIGEGRFEPVFYNDDDFDLLVNKVNSVELLEVAGGGGGSHQSSARGIHRGVLRGVA